MTALTASWLYAVVRDGAPPESLRGVGGGPLRVLAGPGSISAVVSTVDEGSHGAAAIQRNAQDLAWLEHLVREHNDVVEHSARHATTLPVRLGTLFSADEPIADLLRDRAIDLERALNAVAGRREWGVKLYRAPDTAALAAAVNAAPDDRVAGPGMAYLLRRRAQQRAAESASERAAALAQAVHAHLAELAEDHRAYPPQDPRLDPAAATMVLNAAYLVPDRQAAAFLDAAERYRNGPPGVRMQVTGPWPAYTFASMTVGTPS